MAKIPSNVCRVCHREVIVVWEPVPDIDLQYRVNKKPVRMAAIHRGDEAGHVLHTSTPSQVGHLRRRLEEKCEARREQAAGLS